MQDKLANIKAKAYMAITIIIFLLLIIGAAYAYFQVQTNGEGKLNIDASTGTTDNLTFSISDIDTNSSKELDEENKDAKIIIHATKDNFGREAKDLSDGVNVKATLLANNTTNEAKGNYNVFFIIDDNNFEYSLNEETPELILNIVDPGGNEIKEITGLKSVEGGFDITQRHGEFLITSDYDIATTNQTDQDWQVKVTLKNLNVNQAKNEGKTLNGRVYITKEKISTYELPTVNDSSTAKSYNEITFTPEVNVGTEEVKKYYYAIQKEEETTAKILNRNMLKIRGLEFVETDKASYTFKKLDPETKYRIYCYVEDSEGFSSNEYNTEVITRKYYEPVIDNVLFTPELFSIKAQVTAHGRDGEIEKYYYYQDGVLKYDGPNAEYTFEELDDTHEYEITIEAEDVNGIKSTAKVERVSTKEYIYPTIEKVETSSKSWNQINLDVTAHDGSREVKEYWYEVKQGDTTVLTWYKGNAHEEIKNLEPNTEYTINVKVKDELGRENKVIYTTTETTNEYNKATIDVSTSKTENSITVNVEATPGDGEIRKYMYSKNGGLTWEEVESSLLTDEHVFRELTSGVEFDIWVKVVDSNGKESEITKLKVTTLIKVTVKFEGNGNEISKNEEVCYRDKNEATCTVTTPKITAPSNTPEIVGFSKNQSATTAEVGEESEVSVSGNTTYYAITKKSGVTFHVTYTKQGSGVTAIGKESDSCTIDATYNGKERANSCNVTAPSITVSDGYTLVGWSLNKEDITGIKPEATITLTKDETYFTISYKNAITYSVTYNANGNTLNGGTTSCTIDAAYNTNNQGTTCSVTTPKITAPDNTPDIIGFSQGKDNHEAEVGSEASLVLSATNNGATYYAQTTKRAEDVTITFNKNGAQSQTDTNGTAQTTDTVTRSCTKAATYNGVAQVGCTVKSPTIVGTNATSTVIGYSNGKDTHNNDWTHNTDRTVTGDETWFAQTTNADKTFNVTYTKQGSGVTAIGKESDSCTIKATFNGVAQGTSCEVTAPSISVASGYTAVGWSTDKAATTGTAANAKITLTKDETYYSISYKNAITYSVTYNANGNTITGGTTSCKIEAAYNTTTQGATCSVTTPKITAPNNTPDIIGFSQGKDNHEKEVGSEASLVLSATNNGKTYYAQTTKKAEDVTITFNKNGASTQTNSTGTAVGDATVTRSCTKIATYNGVAQAGCTVKSPTIVGTSATPTVTGYSQGKDTHSNDWTPNTEKTVTGNATWFAQTTSPEKTFNITYTKQGNGVTAIGKESDFCKIGATYNGVAQGTSCEVTAPSITVASGYTAVGWSTDKAATTGTAATKTITLTKSETYYSISYKNAITYSVTYNANGNSISGGTTSCTIPAAYNTNTQATSCKVKTPTITGHANTPTVVGYNQVATTHTSQVGSNADLTLDANNNGKTYYAQAKKAAEDVTITFNKNGAKSQTDANGTAQTTDTVTRKCTKAETWNGTAQTGCSVTSPTIVGTDITPTVTGYSSGADTHSNGWTHNTAKTVTSNATWYAQTTRAAVTKKVKFDPNGNTSFNYNKTDYTKATEFDLCTIAAIYNNNGGTAQATSCSATITFPTIEAPAATSTIIGWSTGATTYTKSYGSGEASVKLTASGDLTYYAQTTKAKVTYTVNFNANGNTIDAMSKSCDLAAVYNGASQATSCDITTPKITGHTNTPTVVGYNQVATTHTSEVGSNAKLTVTSSINGKTYYAQAKKVAEEVTITFKKNGAKSQTDANGTAQTTDTVTRKCTKAETWNGTAQTGCNVTSPTIVGTDITPTVTGYSSGADTHSNGWTHNTAKTVTGNATWYAQTTKAAVTKKVKFDPNGNTSFNYNKTDYTKATEFDLCTIAAIYNNNGGTAQATSCSATITMPTIKAHANTPTLIGWSTAAGTHEATFTSGKTSASVTSSGTVTYYAQTTSPEKTFNITYTKQGSGVTAIGKESDSCKIGATYNGVAQGTSCTVTAPGITVASGYTAVGWSTDKAATTGTAATKTITLTKSETYYSISYKNAITYSVTYNANGNSISGGTTSCTIPAAYNTNTQATSCKVKTPTITGHANTTNVIGFSQGKDNHEAEVGSNADLTLTASNNGKTYYAQAKSAEITRSATYNKGSNVSSTSGGTTSCKIASTYNGVAQGTSCNVTLPNFTPASGYLVDGWYSGSTRVGNAGASVSISGNVTYTANVGSVSLTLNSASASQMKVTASVTPTSTPLATKAYQYNTSDSWTSISTTTSTTNTFSVDATGNYTLYIRVTDAKGNVVVKSVGYTNPSVGTPTLESSTWNSLTVKATGTKGTANIAKYCFSDDNGSTFDYCVDVTNSATSGQTTIGSIDPGTSKSVKAYVQDANGRKSSNSSTLTASTKSYTVPSVTIDSVTSPTTDSIKMTYTGTDNSGTIKEYRIFLNNSSKAIEVQGSGTFTYVFSGLKEGTTYTIGVQAVDTNKKPSTNLEFTSTLASQTTGTTPTISAFYIKEKSPTIKYTTTQANNVTMSWASSNIASYCITTVTTASCTNWKSVSPGTKSITDSIYFSMPHGLQSNFTALGFIKDIYGNVSSSKRDYIIYDGSAPTLSINTGTYNNNSEDLVYSVSYGPSGGSVSCVNSSNSDAAVDSYKSITVLGPNTITCTATSGAGLSKTVSGTIILNGIFDANSGLGATGGAYKSGSSIYVPKGGTQYGPYFSAQPGRYIVDYDGTGLNRSIESYVATYNVGVRLNIDTLEYVDTDSHYYFTLSNRLDKIETLISSNTSDTVIRVDRVNVKYVDTG